MYCEAIYSEVLPLEICSVKGLFSVILLCPRRPTVFIAATAIRLICVQSVYNNVCLLKESFRVLGSLAAVAEGSRDQICSSVTKLQACRRENALRPILRASLGLCEVVKTRKSILKHMIIELSREQCSCRTLPCVLAQVYILRASSLMLLLHLSGGHLIQVVGLQA